METYSGSTVLGWILTIVFAILAAAAIYWLAKSALRWSATRSFLSAVLALIVGALVLSLVFQYIFGLPLYVQANVTVPTIKPAGKLEFNGQPVTIVTGTPQSKSQPATGSGYDDYVECVVNHAIVKDVSQCPPIKRVFKQQADNSLTYDPSQQDENSAQGAAQPQSGLIYVNPQGGVTSTVQICTEDGTQAASTDASWTINAPQRGALLVQIYSLKGLPLHEIIITPGMGPQSFLEGGGKIYVCPSKDVAMGVHNPLHPWITMDQYQNFVTNGTLPPQ